jgi:hypothetical protein
MCGWVDGHLVPMCACVQRHVHNYVMVLMLTTSRPCDGVAICHVTAVATVRGRHTGSAACHIMAIVVTCHIAAWVWCRPALCCGVHVDVLMLCLRDMAQMMDEVSDVHILSKW